MQATAASLPTDREREKGMVQLAASNALMSSVRPWSGRRCWAGGNRARPAAHRKGEVRDGAAVEVLCCAVPGVTRRGGTAPGAGARGRRGCSDARRGEEEDDAADVRARCVSDSGEEEAAGLLG